MTHTFTITPTSPTGAEHTLAVSVYGTRDEMIDALMQLYPESDYDVPGENGTRTGAAFIPAAGFFTHQSPVELGHIVFCEEFLDIGTIAHEATHAGMFVYQCDVLGNYSRAMAHVNPWNEEIAYLIGDLVADIGTELYDLGLYADQDKIIVDEPGGSPVPR